MQHTKFARNWGKAEEVHGRGGKIFYDHVKGKLRSRCGILILKAMLACLFREFSERTTVFCLNPYSV